MFVSAIRTEYKQRHTHAGLKRFDARCSPGTCGERREGDAPIDSIRIGFSHVDAVSGTVARAGCAGNVRNLIKFDLWVIMCAIRNG